MRLIDLFEARFQEIVHHNPSVATLKALARNNRYHSARFVILKDGDVIAADSEHFTHHSMAPYMGAWELKGYVQYIGDNEYAYRSMEVYSALNKDHPILRIWERGGIENGNPDQSHLGEHVVKDQLITRPAMDLFKHTDTNLDNQVQEEKLSDDLDGLVIYKNSQVAAYLLVQNYQGNAWMLEAATTPKFRRQGLNSLLIDSAVKKYGRVFADMELTPDSVLALESYVTKTAYRVYRFDTTTGHLWDYSPNNPQDQQLPMYDRSVPGIARPADADAAKWVWAFGIQKPRHPLLMGYMIKIDSHDRPDRTLAEAWSKKYKKRINCSNPKGFGQRAHCAGRKARQAHRKTKSRSINEQQPSARLYPHWTRYTPQSLQSDWNEYEHKQHSKWHKRAETIGARWPLFVNLDQFKHALDHAEAVNIDSLDQYVNNLTVNDDIDDIKDMVGQYQQPRDVDRIVQGMHKGTVLPMPIILQGNDGLWIMAGNTRQSVSRVLGYQPQALLVDVRD